MPGGGMELWAIVPELTLATAVLILLPLGSFLSGGKKDVATVVAMLALAAAAVACVPMLSWIPQAAFLDTYVVDALAVFMKLFFIAVTAATLVAVSGYFRGARQEGAVPALLILTCLGAIGLAASQDLILIALFIQLVSVGSYILAGIVKDDQKATESALKLFLYSATAGAVMLYGMTLLYADRHLKLAGARGTPALELPHRDSRVGAAVGRLWI
jgi:NADH-quinone oxidoreductase subunit N